jgi:hypothetical protein
MKLTNEEMSRLYRRQTARSRAGRAECLSEEAMTRAAEGGLSQSEREVIADHLMACSDCAEEYRILRELKPWAERAAVSAYERESAIKSVSAPPGKEARVVPRQSGLAGRAGWASSARRLAGIFSAGFQTYAIAAALLVVSLACVAWVISLKRENARMAARLNEQLASRDQASQSLTDARRELEAATRRAEQQQTEIAELRRSVDDLSQPQVNVPITDLEQQANRRGGDGATTVTAPVGANIFTLILHVADGPSFPDYALEVIDGRGQRLMRARSLRKSQLNTFTVALPRRLLPAGRYRLKLYGLRSGHGEVVGEVVAEYQMRLNYLKE